VVVEESPDFTAIECGVNKAVGGRVYPNEISTKVQIFLEGRLPRVVKDFSSRTQEQQCIIPGEHRIRELSPILRRVELDVNRCSLRLQRSNRSGDRVVPESGRGRVYQNTRRKGLVLRHDGGDFAEQGEKDVEGDKNAGQHVAD